MPGMPRLNKKTRKIAYKIMGVPPNIADKRSKEEKRINKRLIYEETYRVR